MGVCTTRAKSRRHRTRGTCTRTRHSESLPRPPLPLKPNAASTVPETVGRKLGVCHQSEPIPQVTAGRRRGARARAGCRSPLRRPPPRLLCARPDATAGCHSEGAGLRRRKSVWLTREGQSPWKTVSATFRFARGSAIPPFTGRLAPLTIPASRNSDVFPLCVRARRGVPGPTVPFTGVTPAAGPKQASEDVTDSLFLRWGQGQVGRLRHRGPAPRVSAGPPDGSRESGF